MVWIEVAIWKIGVKITSFSCCILSVVLSPPLKYFFSFNFREKKYKSSKSCLLLGSFVVGQKINPLFRSDISDSLG